MGKFNSSKTRVQPILRCINGKNELDWLEPLLMSLPNPYAMNLAQFCGRIHSDLFTIKLNSKNDNEEVCFEYPINPPRAFLEWLIMNISEEDYDEARKTNISPSTLEKRYALCMRDPAVQAQALALLDHSNGGSLPRIWYVLEGATIADCFLETDTTVVILEGKRTEDTSKRTSWYRHRDQIARNLECLKDYARPKGKEYGVILISESRLNPTYSEVEVGWPHIPEEERRDLYSHFLGETTWADICDLFKLDRPECLDAFTGRK